jgi:hypothetical protein
MFGLDRLTGSTLFFARLEANRRRIDRLTSAGISRTRRSQSRYDNKSPDVIHIILWLDCTGYTEAYFADFVGYVAQVVNCDLWGYSQLDFDIVRLRRIRGEAGRVESRIYRLPANLDWIRPIPV